MLKKLLFIGFSLAALGASAQPLVFGVVDSRGKTIIPFEYEDIMPLNEDSKLYCAKKATGWGAIDAMGNEVIPFVYLGRLEFGKGFICAKSQEGKCGALDFHGKEILPFRYEEFLAYDKNIMYAKEFEKDTVIHVFNNMGKELLPAVYTHVSRFTDAYFIVQKGFKFGLVDTLNNIIFPLEYDHIKATGNGFLDVRKCDITTYIWRCRVYNDRLERVTKNEYEYVEWDCPDRLLIVRNRGKSGLIRLDGNDTQLLPMEYKWIHYEKGRQPIGIVRDRNDKYAAVDHKGKLLTDFIYSYIDIKPYESRQMYCTFQYERASDFTPKNVRNGFMDEKGRILLPLTGEESSRMYVSPVNKKAFIVAELLKKEDGTTIFGKFGIFDRKGRQITPFDYDDVFNSLYYIDQRLNAATGASIPLPANHILVKTGDTWSIRNIYKKKPILSGYRQFNGVHDGHYIVGK